MSDESETEERALKPGMKECSTCAGSGQVEGEPCNACEGTGEVPTKGQQNSETEDTEARHNIPDRLRGTIERRSFSTDGAEIRSTADGGLRFSGYASTTETPYPVGRFEETFSRGAFKRCLNSEPDVVFLINHDGLPLARTTSGTLTLTEDARGLKVDADLDPSDPDVQAILPKMKRGDLTEMSFAFKATDDEWSDHNTRRLVRSATIHKGDVSIVTKGANTSATASVRSVIEEMEQRSGKTISKATQEKLERIKKEADALLAEPEAEAEAEVQSQEAEAAILPASRRSQIELAKAYAAKGPR